MESPATNQILDWLTTLETGATNPATNQKVSGTWVELVKVKKWYSLRRMKWDATNKKKVYDKYIGTLESCKKNPVYAQEARRLEQRRFGVSGGAIIPDTRAYQPHAEYLH